MARTLELDTIQYPSASTANIVLGSGTVVFDANISVDINAGTIDGCNVTVGSGKTLDVSAGSLSLGAGQITTAAIADDAVTAAKIADGAITSAHIAADTVVAADIAANAITASELADNAVDTAAIADDAVTSAKIADGAVITASLATDGVTYAKMQDIATANRVLGRASAGEISEVQVATDMIADSAVSTAKLANDGVTYAKIQNVSATDRILGRDSAGAGIVEEITPANLRTMNNVADGANAYAHPTSAGNKHIPSGGSSGDYLKYSSSGTAVWSSLASDAPSYSHPTHPGDDFSQDTGALTGANVVSDIDINLTTDTLGHVTDANCTIATRALTLTDLGIGSGNDVQFDSLGIGTAATGTTGEIRATDNITAYYSSDKRLKENIKEIPDALNKIDQIRGVNFEWNAQYIEDKGGEVGYFVNKKDVGVIAQEVKEILPEVVRERDDGYLAVKYEGIIPLLIEAIKELRQEIKELKFHQGGE